jgi:hypothetical protein
MGSGAAGQYLGSRGRGYKTARSTLPDCLADDCPADVGGVTEWLMVADCKSAGLTPYVGSNPTPTMEAGNQVSGEAGQDDAGVAQLVEHQPSKLRVAGSSPVARFARMDGWTDGQAVGCESEMCGPPVRPSI